LVHPPPTSTLFPYTTLFRSRVPRQHIRPASHIPPKLGARIVVHMLAPALGDLLHFTVNMRRQYDFQPYKLIAHRAIGGFDPAALDRKSTRLNSSHVSISYAG